LEKEPEGAPELLDVACGTILAGAGKDHIPEKVVGSWTEKLTAALERSEPAARNNLIYDAAGGLGGVAGEIVGTAGRGDGTPMANRGVWNRESDRVLCEHNWCCGVDRIGQANSGERCWRG